ncbi:hypothetical protein ANN_21279 [Periplaneta americana]|uniref:DUF4817 domain-containing protein n=1 Tax=Periplaneta americana TaxID=6978 RepID=A0ABQ8SEV8_PERAM|nr:hypothetical protein ANN_21279 [Periplaneta americana]
MVTQNSCMEISYVLRFNLKKIPDSISSFNWLLSQVESHVDTGFSRCQNFQSDSGDPSSFVKLSIGYFPGVKGSRSVVSTTPPHSSAEAKLLDLVHRCGVTACLAVKRASPGSNSGWNNLTGFGFFGVFPQPIKSKCRVTSGAGPGLISLALSPSFHPTLDNYSGDRNLTSIGIFMYHAKSDSTSRTGMLLTYCNFASEYIIRKAKVLAKGKGILCSPNPKPGKPLLVAVAATKLIFLTYIIIIIIIAIIAITIISTIIIAITIIAIINNKNYVFFRLFRYTGCFKNTGLNFRSLPSKETLRGYSDSSFRGESYIQCCVGVRLCDMYSNQEQAEIHFMYGKADGNAALARRLYQERYPQRQCPDRKTFVRLHYRLCEYGQI